MLLLQFDEPGGNRSVLLEDDGRVAYGYLLHGERITSDVWLYNVGSDPDGVNWRDASAMPFQNPAKYCARDALRRLETGTDVRCQWSERGATVWVDGVLWARLEEGAKPGWSRGARSDGPLAKSLTS